MRYKSWPYYKDWVVVFGKDRATGEKGGTADCILNRPAYVPVQAQQTQSYADMPPQYAETDMSQEGGGDTSSSVRTVRQCKRKREPLVVPQDNTHMVNLMSGFFTDVNTQMMQLVSKVGAATDAATARRNLFDQMDFMTQLTVEQKLSVSKILATNSVHVDVFNGLSDDVKATMVKMILEGKY